MKFIEALRLRSKLLSLFVLMSLGLFAVGIMGTYYVKSMKKSVDTLYFGYLLPVVELGNILQIYHGELVLGIYRAKSGAITPSELNFIIENSLMKIQKDWRNYEAHFKKNSEIAYVEYVASEIKKTNDYFKSLQEGVLHGASIQQISLKYLDAKISNIHNTIKKLIGYEIEVAKYERGGFLDLYESILFEIGLVLLLIITTLFGISYFVFKSIQSDHTKLELATKQLKALNKQLENASYTDSLTALHNRRYFNFVYDRELKRARRTHSYITFMMLDIDYFKQYNDTYGHIEGDFALKSVAKVLKDKLKRPSDFVFRLGGEEFGVLLVDTDESSSAHLAREICDAIKKREIRHEASKVNEYLTISIGVVCCIADEALNDEALLSQADKMLYKAKESGRDTYMITTNVSKLDSVTA